MDRKIKKKKLTLKRIERKITNGRQNTEVFEALSGLHPGERVITSSYGNYGDNIEKLILK